MYALSNALILGLGFMLIYQVVILLLNKTTYEVAMDARRNPFRHPGFVRNFEMVFGFRKCTWLSPFHDPFPGLKLIGYVPTHRQMRALGANSTASSQFSARGGTERTLDYIECILPTLRVATNNINNISNISTLSHN